MNKPRWIQRHLVKAFAAGTLLAVAALPAAVATEAGASTVPPSLTSVVLDAPSTTTIAPASVAPTFTLATTSGSTSATLTVSSGTVSLPVASYVVTDTGAGTELTGATNGTDTFTVSGSALSVTTTAGAVTLAKSAVSTGTDTVTLGTIGTFTVDLAAGSKTATLSASTGASASLLANTTYTLTDSGAYLTSGTTGGTDTFTVASAGTVNDSTPLSITLGTAAYATNSADPVTVEVTASSAPVYATAAVTPSTTTGAFSGTAISGSSTVTLTSNTTTTTVPAGSILTGTGLATDTFVTSTASVTSGGTTVSIFPAATGAVSGTITVNAPASVPAFGAGGLPNGESILVTGTGFAADGGNASITSSDPDLSFSNVTELTSNLLMANVATTAATTTGSASITLTDNNGTSQPLMNAFTVNPDPTVTSMSVVSIANGQTVTGIVVSGTGFDTSGDSVMLTNTTDGTSLMASVTNQTSTALTISVTALNSFTGGSATAGSYTLTVINGDGGSVTTAPIFTVTAAGISNVSPSEVPATANGTASIVISGNGFQAGATVALTCTSSAASIVSADTVVISPTTINAVVATTATTGVCNVTVTNPGAPGNGAVFTAVGALGIGTPATNATATISSVTLNPSGPITVGSTATTPVTMTITGSGFSAASTVQFLEGTTSTVDSAVTGSCTAATNGTTLTCALTVGSGAVAGTDGVVVVNNGVASSPFEGAVTIAGPSITSASPATVAAGAPVGTVITLTGVGFNSTATATVNGLSGVFAVTSPTTATFALTAVPTVPSSGYATFQISEYIATGTTVSSPVFKYAVGAAPTVSSLVNSLNKLDTIGAGAVKVPVTIYGSGFASGATIGSFVNAYGVADSGVTATVQSVAANGNSLVALVSVAAGDANLSDGYTITNPNGGVVKVPGFSANGALFIDAGPTITSVTPATATGDSTVAFTIVGTNFVGSTVQPSANGTCAATTVVSLTNLTVSCTFSAATSTPASLVVTNSDGGSATSAVVLAAATPTPPVTPPAKPAFKVVRVLGAVIRGQHGSIGILGSGFYGQPTVRANVPGVRTIVSHDNGSVLTVVFFATAHAPLGIHVFTVILANGKRANLKFNLRA